MKKAKIIIFAIVVALLLSACNADTTANAPAGDTSDENSTETKASVEIEDVGYSDGDNDIEWSEGSTKITCSGTDVIIDGSGVTAQSGIITVSSAGEFVFSGDLSGSIVVEANKNAEVQLIFNGINITSEKTSAVNIKKAEKVILTLADGSQNSVTDSDNYVYDDDEKEEPSAAVFSKTDLTVNGGGSIEINAKFNDGITSKDVLRIIGGEITVNSEDDGIIGKDAILISGGSFSINAGGDGLKATNDEDSTLGYIKVDGGSFDITAAADGIQAETQIVVEGGTLSIETGGGSSNASYSDSGFNDAWGRWPVGGFGYMSDTTVTETSSDSAKAIKAGNNINISGGSFEIDSSDDSIHSNGDISITGGSITASSGDDGAHADSALTISGGSITVDKSYEGLEACDITISGGDIKVTATDDGINGAGGNDNSAMGGRPGQNSFASGTATFKISGGSLYVSAVGDGIDINGSAELNGGTVCIFGPTDSGNGAVDYDSTFEANGGTFIALGSSGMLQGFSGGTQASVTCTMSSISAGEILSLESADGKVLFTAEVEKTCSALVFSSSELEVGETYTLYRGEGESKTSIGSYTQSQTTMGGSSGGGHPGGQYGGYGKPMR